MRLRPLTVDDEAAARQAHNELEADDFSFLLGHDPTEPWAVYVHRLRQYARGLDLPADLVPAAFLVADVGGDVVGRVSIRYQLNDSLRRLGGHIGYGVRPGFRRRGYATEILRQSLVVARAQGVGRALLTCDDANAGSARTIERCGGRLLETEAGTRRYWID
ncbi:MAG TPA: GNAT family N-acetyltransferase [Mycobacteriales bacterium]|jgi:predicted acetyltransferase|nr:GNAT family N-acetyltransferase [Mycobacteriales bacterium]